MVKLSILTISDIVDSIKKSYDVRNLKELCRDLSIILMYSGMGKTENACKGFFLTYSKIKTITINTDLPELIQNIVLAHELGHAILHKNATSHLFHEFQLFDEVSTLEYEANIFAAEMLLDDDVVLEYLNENYSFFQVASKLNVPVELLDFKFKILKQKGYKLVSPINTKNTFLKRDLGGDYYE